MSVFTHQSTAFFLKDSRIGLRAVEKSDLTAQYLAWMNDSTTTEFLNYRSMPQTMESLEQYWAAQQKDNVLFLALCLLNGEHLGNIHVGPIDWVNRRVDVAFMVGHPEHRGKGYVTAALALIEDHCFNTLGLHRLQAGYEAGNKGSEKVFKKRGWQVEGSRRQAVFRQGTYHDLVIVGKLVSEFRAQQRASRSEDGVSTAKSSGKLVGADTP